MRKLTKPQDIQDTKSYVDEILDLLENEFAKAPVANEFGTINIEIPGRYILLDKQEVKSMYLDAGWKDVSFQTKDNNTVFRFRK